MSLSLYFAAITGRDYIKHNGKKTPFWDLLDNQPSGWLTSIVDIKAGLPSGSLKMFDCGAWTYRDEEIPILKGREVTPEYAYDEYKKAKDALTNSLLETLKALERLRPCTSTQL